MARGQRSKESLNSGSHLSFINVFIPQTVIYTERKSTVATFLPYQYRDTSIQLPEIEDGIIRKFPIIFKSNGEPWDLGNLYLMWKFSEMAKFKPPVIDTLTSIAKHLTMYLRWIEHNQSLGHTIHELDFPEATQERVTYRYHRYLKRLLRQRPQPITLGVVKARMGAVVNFYKGLIKGNLVCPSKIDNPPYESKVSGIPIVSNVGLKRIINVETTDLSFKKPKRQEGYGEIKDGGVLRPLTDTEQQIINDELWEYGNREFQLMMWIALFTGARKQTIGTMRVKHIRELFNKRHKNNQELLLPVGEGTDIDTKQGTSYRLHIPLPLAQLLIEYADSPRATERRQNSFYGNTDDNYLFLTRHGTPYYTSKVEIKDRQNPKFSHRIALKERIDFPISDGQAITNYVQRLIKQIRLNYPNFNHFRFHDLRATFGMNFVRQSLRTGIPPDEILQLLKVRMGHSNIQTTLGYLNYDNTTNQLDELSTIHFNWLKEFTNREVKDD